MSLVLHGVDYGPVQSASGAQGWFGEGYWFHRWIPGLNWSGCTFVSKTTTLYSRKGHMALDTQGRSKEWLPKCIVVKPWKGVVLNSVGLSGPGAEALVAMGEWQKQEKPFFLSFMSVASSRTERMAEALGFAVLLGLNAKDFASPFGIQVNLSCPNTGHDTSKIAEEAREILGVFQGLRYDQKIPIVPKFNVLFPVEAVAGLQILSDAICISNTLPWGTLSADVNWGKYATVEPFDPKAEFIENEDPTPRSPLHHLGGGGLSGWPLLPLVAEWVKAARECGVDLPINAGGGILKPDDVDVLVKAGADSVFLGSIAILRGWRLKRTIRRAHRLLGQHTSLDKDR